MSRQQMLPAVMVQPEIGVAVDKFDYTGLDVDVANAARAAAERIRFRASDTVLKTGQDLIAIKAQMDHGMFGAWVASEVGISARSAENYMAAARFLEGKSATVADLPPAAIYALAARSAPAEAVNELVAAVESGIRLRPEQVKDRLAVAIAAAREAKKPPKQVASERKVRLSRAAREARRRREIEADREKEVREELERTERLRPLAEQIAAALSADLPKLINALGRWSEARSLHRLLTGGVP